jgi:hypothetical protein
MSKTMSTYELLLYLHILGVFGLIADADIVTAVGICASRSSTDVAKPGTGATSNPLHQREP